MSQFRLLFSAVLVFLCVTVAAQQKILSPYATYEQVFQYSDGQISVNQTAQLKLSDDGPGGLLNVGAYRLKVQSLPPRLLYRAREVGRIPKTATMHMEEVCLVASSQPDDSPAAINSTLNTGTTRRLLRSVPFFLFLFVAVVSHRCVSHCCFSHRSVNSSI